MHKTYRVYYQAGNTMFASGWLYGGWFRSLADAYEWCRRNDPVSRARVIWPDESESEWSRYHPAV